MIREHEKACCTLCQPTIISGITAPPEITITKNEALVNFAKTSKAANGQIAGLAGSRKERVWGLNLFLGGS